MQHETDKGYALWGHAVPEGGSFAASGTVTRGKKLLQACATPGLGWTEEKAHAIGLACAREWVGHTETEGSVSTS
jgi:hypothetical protein